MSQHQLIAQYIDDFNTITPFQAFADLGITKLATRVSEMKKQGYKFKQEVVQSYNRYGKPVRYMRYGWQDERTSEIGG